MLNDSLQQEQTKKQRGEITNVHTLVLPRTVFFLMSLARVVFCAAGSHGNNTKYCTQRSKRCGSLGYRQFLYTSIGLK